MILQRWSFTLPFCFFLVYSDAVSLKTHIEPGFNCRWCNTFYFHLFKQQDISRVPRWQIFYTCILCEPFTLVLRRVSNAIMCLFFSNQMQQESTISASGQSSLGHRWATGTRWCLFSYLEELRNYINWRKHSELLNPPVESGLQICQRVCWIIKVKQWWSKWKFNAALSLGCIMCRDRWNISQQFTRLSVSTDVKALEAETRACPLNWCLALSIWYTTPQREEKKKKLKRKQGGEQNKHKMYS